MKLEPVFLVAPKPKPPSMPTRRAWLLAGGSFLAGALGGACAMSLADEGARADGKAEAPVDPMQSWLRELCQDATPIETLIENRTGLYQHLPRWSDDLELWHGIDRLAQAAVDPTSDLERRMAAELAAFLERADAPSEFMPSWSREQLRSAAEGR